MGSTEPLMRRGAGGEAEPAPSVEAVRPSSWLAVADGRRCAPQRWTVSLNTAMDKRWQKIIQAILWSKQVNGTEYFKYITQVKQKSWERNDDLLL